MYVISYVGDVRAINIGIVNIGLSSSSITHGEYLIYKPFLDEPCT